MNTNQNKLISDLIVDETRNHNLTTSALINFLANKGIIDPKEFYQYEEEFAKALIKRNYPFLDVEHYKSPDDCE